jgi:DNA processing protein
VSASDDVVALDREDRHYPSSLAASGAPPRELYVASGVERLCGLLAEPAVAIAGSRAASDYGLEVAHDLARGLAASGVTVIAGLAEGIGGAALSGALAVAGPTIAVVPSRLDIGCPTPCACLYCRVREVGCAVSQWPCGTQPSRWSRAARARLLAALAQLVIVVEADDHVRALAPARIAQAEGKRVGAVPGRVGSRLSRGPHALIAEGAALVRDAEDVLDLLYRAPAGALPKRAGTDGLDLDLREAR